jgi:hypothetical protein
MQPMEVAAHAQRGYGQSLDDLADAHDRLAIESIRHMPSAIVLCVSA